MLLHKAVPGSKNPFLTPTGQLRGERDSPPHLAPPFSHEQTRFPQMQLIPRSVGSSSSDEGQYPPHKSGPITRVTKFNEIYGQMGIDPNDDQDVIREKTMAGVPAWPTDLRLSLNANNWLEWSREVLNNLKMAQLHVYPITVMDSDRLDIVSKGVRAADVCTKTKPDSVSAHGKQNYLFTCTKTKPDWASKYRAYQGKVN
jgi:hypothetical protein